MSIKYSEKLKSAVMGFVKDERQEEDDPYYMPIEIGYLEKKDYPNDYKNYKTDYLCEDSFIVEFEDIIKIVVEDKANE
jgi:hypothetical protein